MNSLEQTSFTPGPDIIFGEWEVHPERRWELRRDISCSVCGVSCEVTKTDTWHGGNKDVTTAEKRALQSLIDQGCTHVQTTASMKALDPNDFTQGKGGKGRGHSHGGKGKK